MKYILMCGGRYDKFKTPKHLFKVNGEVIIERTIRLLKENGISDIAISTDNPAFDYLDVPKLKHENNFICYGKEENKQSKYSWLNAYYPIDEPCCYIHGDVWFTENAIKTIINTKVKETMFFCVPDVQDGRKSINAKGREPLAYKVENQKVFRKAINDLLKMVDDGIFKDKIPPISWHLYRYINGLDYILTDWGVMNNIFDTKGDYVIIDDITTDVDNINDILDIERYIKIGGEKMVKCEVINQNVTIREFNRLKNIKRIKGNDEITQANYFEVGDTFETDEDMAKYLAGETLNQPLVCVKVLEVVPEKKEEIKPTIKVTSKVTKNIKGTKIK